MSKYKDVLKYIQLYTGCNDHALKRIDVMLQEKIKAVPDKIVEVRYVEKFSRKGIDPNLTLADFTEQYCAANNTSYKMLCDRSRKTEIVINRNRFVTSAYKEGYSASELGRYLGFCHASILHALHESKKK
jgi:hypothetical protein